MDILSILGSIASVVGIAITLYQMREIKLTTKATQIEVKNRMDDIEQFFTYAEIEKSETFSALILSYIRGQEYEAAALKIEEIKKILFNIKNNLKLQNIDNIEIQKCIQNLSIDINSIRAKKMLGTNFNIEIIMFDLGNSNGILQDISTKLKVKSYDRE